MMSSCCPGSLMTGLFAEHLLISFCSLIVSTVFAPIARPLSSKSSLTTSRTCAITPEGSRLMRRPPRSHHTCTQTRVPVPAAPFALSSAYPVLRTINSTGSGHSYFHKSPPCHFQMSQIYSPESGPEQHGGNEEERRKEKGKRWSVGDENAEERV